MTWTTSKRCGWWIALTAAVFAATGTTPADQANASFCETSVVHNYGKPLKRMPGIRKIPAGEHLPFGPARVFAGRTGSPLLVGPSTSGFSLFFSPYRQGTRFSPRLDWLVEARAFRVDRRGRAIDLIGRQKKKIKRLRSSDERPSGTVDLSFELTRPGLYRTDMTISNWSGKRLIRYGEYLRLIRPRTDFRLTLNATAFYPGQTVSAQLENRGTDWLSYGLGYSVDRFNGVAWERVPGEGRIIRAIGLGTGPGGAASCWSYSIPADATPGLHRFVKEVSYSRIAGREREIALTSEFQILPAR